MARDAVVAGEDLIARERLDLLDYRRQVAAMYAAVRQDGGGERAHREFRATRNRLFARHPQSPLDVGQRELFGGLEYFPYDPRLRFCLPVSPHRARGETLEVRLEEDGILRLERFGLVDLEHEGKRAQLSLYWMNSYGGGLFLPFGDATNAAETYGGGRYLIDSIKGADLGQHGDALILDFNYAYNPSCAYDNRWHCPLAPPQNRLDFPIRGGEKTFIPS